jgi:propanol-preferring alcohol dehydrogenase
MRAALFHGPGRPVTVDDVPVPVPRAGEVRVRVGACGICGSDLHILDGTTSTAPPPIVLGHEGAGVVDALGPTTTGPDTGQPVVITPGYGCGTCAYCRSGRENVCPDASILGITRDGAQADYVVVPAGCLVPLDRPLDPAVAAVLTDAVATPLHAIRRSGVRAGQTAAVFGLGGLGLPAVMLLRQVYEVDVIGVDPRPAAREQAARYGAGLVIDPADGRPARAVRAATADGVDVSFEFVGAASVTDQAVKSLRRGGVCTVVGVTPDQLALGVRQETLVAGELTVQGSFGATRDDLAELVGLVSDGRLDVSPVVTHRFPLERFADAVAQLRRPDGDAVRVVVVHPSD